MSLNHDTTSLPNSYQHQHAYAGPYDAHVSPRPAPPSTATNQNSSVVVQPSVIADGSQYPGNGVLQPQIAAVPAFQQQQRQQQQIPVQQFLPLGAVPYNGGILYHSNVFANSYRIPGPNGNGWIFYDVSVPMPPQPPAVPSASEQWHSLTKLLKLFVILVVGFWLLQLFYHWKVGVCMPILFLWAYLLHREWRKHYQTVELGMLVKLYATAFAPGALVVMIVETVITIFFAFLCFQDAIADFIHQLEGKGTTNPNPTDPDKGEAPSGMEFLNYKESPELFIFVFLLAFVSAGCVEESLKYFLTNRVKKYRPSYRDMHGYLLYALAAALGFSTVENIGYVLGGATQTGGDSTFLGIFLNTLGRTFLSTPLHLLTAYLIGLQVIRRDILGEQLNLIQVMGWSVFFHGLFDFGLFLVMILNRHWSSGPDDNTVSYILMACVLVQCYAGLAYRIWKTRRIVFPHGHDGVQVEHAVDVEAPLPSSSSSGPLGATHIGTGASTNGFQQLHSEPDVATVA